MTFWASRRSLGNNRLSAQEMHFESLLSFGDGARLHPDLAPGAGATWERIISWFLRGHPQ